MIIWCIQSNWCYQNRWSVLVCSMCNYWYFLDINFRFDPKVCNGCHNWIQKFMSFNDVAIIYVKENDYRIHVYE